MQLFVSVHESVVQGQFRMNKGSVDCNLKGRAGLRGRRRCDNYTFREAVLDRRPDGSCLGRVASRATVRDVDPDLGSGRHRLDDFFLFLLLRKTVIK